MFEYPDWETKEPLESGDREFVIVVPTDEVLSKLVDSVDAFLMTSPWGEWSLQDGDPVRRHYRRGAWLKKRNGTFVANERFFGALPAGESPFLQAIKLANADGQKAFPDWPVVLNARFFPAADTATLRLQTKGGWGGFDLGPKSDLVNLAYFMRDWVDFVKVEILEIQKWRINERRQLAAMRCENLFIKSIRNEVGGLAEYLGHVYRLDSPPAITEVETWLQT